MGWMISVRAALVRTGPSLALLGVALAISGSIIAPIAYTGPSGERYSPLNHTVSELGERGVSELATQFNLALFTGGALIALFMLGRALVAEGRAARGFWTIGTLAAVAMALVGVFPVDDLAPHIVVAFLAFMLILLASLWFAIWVFRGAAPYPRWLGWFAAWIAVALLAFLLLPGIFQPEYEFEMDFTAETPRPAVLLNSLLEWVVIVSAWLWIAALAWHHRSTVREGAP